MDEYRRRIQHALSPGFLDDLDSLPTDELRALHTECNQTENESSYVRRLIQARLDIMQAEVERRRKGGSVSDLIASLPEILADAGPRPAPAGVRPPGAFAPERDMQWGPALAPAFDDTLARLPVLSDAELHAAIDALRALEREISDNRRALHGVLARIEHELAGRHKVGLA
jgi:RsiG-like